MPGVELVRRGGEGEEMDVRRQTIVDLPLEGLGIDSALEPQVSRLGQGMHARIRAPRAAQLAHHGPGLLHRPAQLPGHRARVLLLLPAVIPGAFVLQGESVGGHRGGSKSQTESCRCLRRK